MLACCQLASLTLHCQSPAHDMDSSTLRVVFRPFSRQSGQSMQTHTLHTHLTPARHVQRPTRSLYSSLRLFSSDSGLVCEVPANRTLSSINTLISYLNYNLSAGTRLALSCCVLKLLRDGIVTISDCI